MALTKAQRTRLDKLATYLEGLPADYRHFDMGPYFRPHRGDYEAVVRYAQHNGGVPSCGTVACAVGHGPAAGIFVPPRMIGDGVVSWPEYADLFTGTGRQGSEVFEWLFDSGWSRADNHHHGAAARIRYFLDKGVPDGFMAYLSLQQYVPLYAPYRIDAKGKADA